MNFEDFREYCLRKPFVTEGFPFDKSTLVFKVGGKMFLLTDIDLFESVNLKCDPEKCIELRERYQGIIPGFHMNKKHWNTVLLNSDVDQKLFLELLDDSYQLVFNSLSKKIRNELTLG
jgi:predicted DNA-binding protein (MmcQ/YjbR family)